VRGRSGERQRDEAMDGMTNVPPHRLMVGSYRREHTKAIPQKVCRTGSPLKSGTTASDITTRHRIAGTCPTRRTKIQQQAKDPAEPPFGHRNGRVGAARVGWMQEKFLADYRVPCCDQNPRIEHDAHGAAANARDNVS